MENQQEDFDPYTDHNTRRETQDDSSKKHNQIRSGSQTNQNWAPTYTMKDAQRPDHIVYKRISTAPQMMN